MNWNRWIRQGHRWLAILFTLTVITDFLALAMGQPPQWLFYLPLPPLFLLMLSGLYLFFAPYAAKWAGRPA